LEILFLRRTKSTNMSSHYMRLHKKFRPEAGTPKVPDSNNAVADVQLVSK
jgi:hypothetical protein